MEKNLKKNMYLHTHTHTHTHIYIEGFPHGSMVKNPPAGAGHARDTGFIPGSGRSPGRENSSPLQYSCLGNPMDRGAWRAVVHGVTKNQTWLTD